MVHTPKPSNFSTNPSSCIPCREWRHLKHGPSPSGSDQPAVPAGMAAAAIVRMRMVVRGNYHDDERRGAEARVVEEGQKPVKMDARTRRSRWWRVALSF